MRGEKDQESSRHTCSGNPPHSDNSFAVPLGLFFAIPSARLASTSLVAIKAIPLLGTSDRMEDAALICINERRKSTTAGYGP